MALQDTFEDAQDTTSRPQTPPAKATEDLPRSVTEGEPSSTTSTPKLPTTAVTSQDSTDNSPDDPGPVKDVNGADEDPSQKSPLLTAHRVSTSSLENASSEGKADTMSVKSSSSIDPPSEKTPDQPISPKKNPPKTRGLSGNLPSMPWVPSPNSKASGSTSTSVAPKKLGMSFSWLSRGGSVSKENVNAPQTQPAHSASSPERRNTVTSLNSITSNPEMMLSKLGEEPEQEGLRATTVSKPHRDNLRERFKMLRMREEAGILSPDGQEGTSLGGNGALAGLIGRSATVGLGIGSPTSVADEKEGGLAGSPPQSPDGTVPSNIVHNTNPTLAPGTVSGMSAGISAINDPTEPVNWDLWQSVVYEGPAAVARTSAEELNRSIASGIPSAIRGVVWQVLAQSKNEELEGVYRELVVRGTDKDRDHVAAMSGQLSQNTLANGHTKEKQSIASSGSSVHSDHSTLAASTANGITSPSSSNEKESENVARLQAAMIAERKQKAKEDAASLTKLEKVIKRDLGARTSYSKYAAASGLQDGLFGVCKAYALFDEGVGYAQGMNFLVMPLLFNVRMEIVRWIARLMIFRCPRKKPFVFW